MNAYFKLCFISLLLFVSCKTRPHTTEVNNTFDPSIFNLNPTAKIGQYVVEVFEDSKGNLWFGTLSKGIAKYDGHSLKYYTIQDGLPNNAVVSVVEDDKGILWVGTQNGLSAFDGIHFTNYLVDISDDESRISNLLIDSKGILWIGTWAGIKLFDGIDFISLELPNPNVELADYLTTMNWITELGEDESGNIWIGRDGYGITIYDGEKFSFRTKLDGLLSNNVTDYIIESENSVWVSSRMVERDDPSGNKTGDAGVVLLTGNSKTNFKSKEGLFQSDVYALYESNDDNIWIGTLSNGLYRYNGMDFNNYQFEGEENKPIQQIMKDSKGQLWLGCSGGLYKLENETIKHYPIGKFL